MLRKHLVLMAPGAVEDAATGQEAADQLHPGMGSWMKAIGELEDPATTKEPDGKSAATGTTDTGATGAAANAAAAKGDGNVPPKTAGADDAAAKAKAEAAAIEAAAAAERAKNKAADDAKAKGDEDKWPRNSNDWEAFKKKRAEKESALQAEIKTRDTKLQEYENQVKQLQEAASKGDVPKEITSELEGLRKTNKELTDRITILDVTQHPDFQAYFSAKEAAQIERMKAIVSPEKAGAFEEAMRMVPGKPRDSMLEDLISDMPTWLQGRIGTVLENWDGIAEERKAEIRKAADHKGTITKKNEGAVKDIVAQRDKILETIAKEVQDGKNGHIAYMPKEGDSTWNTAVKSRLDQARNLLTGKGVTPQQIVRAAFDAAAFPAVLEAYKADMQERDQQIKSLTEQVSKLSAATPRTEGAAKDSGQGGSSTPDIKSGMTPQEATSAWLKKAHAEYAG